MEISAKIVVTKEIVKNVLTLSIPELLNLGFTILELNDMGIVEEHRTLYCGELDVFFDTRLGKDSTQLFKSDGTKFEKPSNAELDRNAYYYMTGEYAD